VRARGALAVLVLVGGAVAAGGCARWRSDADSPRPGPGVFTPAHRTVGAAVAAFVGWRATPVQPLPFPHHTHVSKGIACTDCHDSAALGPVAGIPGVKTCMICHESMATDRPLIQLVAAYAQRQEDLPWQRVYGYPAAAHVRFQHAPHVRAQVACATCHGDVETQTVAERRDLTMGFCVTCHQTRHAALDCLACHF
jgi:hypothetical protein